MNWLLIAVICIIAWNVVRGYTRGVLRMVYSLAAWIVMLAASTVAAPYVRDHILSQTGIDPVILNGIEKQIAIQGQKATGDFDMANILLQKSGAYDTISAQLTNAIIVQAAKDYTKALRRLKKFPHDKEARYIKQDCERFFRSGWFEVLTDLNGEVLIQRMNEEVYAV